LIVPFAILLPVMSLDLADVIFGYGAAEQNVQDFATALALFAPGLVFFTTHYLMLRGFYSIERTRTVFWVQCVIAATNIDLQELVQRSEFREDLYYRLNVINIKLPPLRDRREDIPLLVDHFVAKYAAENGKAVRSVVPEALAILVDHTWPGNVRELENVIERAVVLSSSPVIGTELLPEPLLGDRTRPLPGPVQIDGSMSFYETMERMEREIIVETLKSVNGVQRKAAARLGLNPTTLNEKIKRLKIQYR